MHTMVTGPGQAPWGFIQDSPSSLHHSLLFLFNLLNTVSHVLWADLTDALQEGDTD